MPIAQPLSSTSPGKSDAAVTEKLLKQSKEAGRTLARMTKGKAALEKKLLKQSIEAGRALAMMTKEKAALETALASALASFKSVKSKMEAVKVASTKELARQANYCRKMETSRLRAAAQREEAREDSLRLSRVLQLPLRSKVISLGTVHVGPDSVQRACIPLPDWQARDRVIGKNAEVVQWLAQLTGAQVHCSEAGVATAVGSETQIESAMLLLALLFDDGFYHSVCALQQMSEQRQQLAGEIATCQQRLKEEQHLLVMQRQQAQFMGNSLLQATISVQLKLRTERGEAQLHALDTSRAGLQQSITAADEQIRSRLAHALAQERQCLAHFAEERRTVELMELKPELKPELGATSELAPELEAALPSTAELKAAPALKPPRTEALDIKSAEGFIVLAERGVLGVTVDTVRSAGSAGGQDSGSAATAIKLSATTDAASVAAAIKVDTAMRIEPQSGAMLDPEPDTKCEMGQAPERESLKAMEQEGLLISMQREDGLDTTRLGQLQRQRHDEERAADQQRHAAELADVLRQGCEEMALVRAAAAEERACAVEVAKMAGDAALAKALAGGLGGRQLSVRGASEMSYNEGDGVSALWNLKQDGRGEWFAGSVIETRQEDEGRGSNRRLRRSCRIQYEDGTRSWSNLAETCVLFGWQALPMALLTANPTTSATSSSHAPVQLPTATAEPSAAQPSAQPFTQPTAQPSAQLPTQSSLRLIPTIHRLPGELLSGSNKVVFEAGRYQSWLSVCVYVCLFVCMYVWCTPQRNGSRPDKHTSCGWLTCYPCIRSAQHHRSSSLCHKGYPCSRRRSRFKKRSKWAMRRTSRDGCWRSGSIARCEGRWLRKESAARRGD